MSVDSYLELFTTLFGWAFYGVLWDVLVGTGIVYLPFLGILIDNWREPAEGGEFGTATGLSLRRMEIELFIALLVVVLAGQPAALTPLNAGTLSYSPIPTLGNPAPPAATVAAPQSTYGSTGFTGSPATVNVPVWWYAVLAMTSGFYDSLRPSKQIPGWAYDPARDTEYDPADPPTWGKPTCKQWWEDAGQGLRKQLMGERGPLCQWHNAAERTTGQEVRAG